MPSPPVHTTWWLVAHPAAGQIPETVERTAEQHDPPLHVDGSQSQQRCVAAVQSAARQLPDAPVDRSDTKDRHGLRGLGCM